MSRFKTTIPVNIPTVEDPDSFVKASIARMQSTRAHEVYEVPYDERYTIYIIKL